MGPFLVVDKSTCRAGAAAMAGRFGRRYRGAPCKPPDSFRWRGLVGYGAAGVVVIGSPVTGA